MKEYRFKINGKEYNVNVCGISDGQATVTVNGVGYTVDCDFAGAAAPAAGAGVPAPDVQQSPSSREVADAQPSNRPLGTGISGGKKIEAPLPGVIIAVHATPGQAVKRGQRIAVLEAMKMENDILAPVDGTVKEILVQRGDSVLEGATIATIE